MGQDQQINGANLSADTVGVSACLTQSKGHKLLGAGRQAPQSSLTVSNHPGDVARLHTCADQLSEFQLADAPQDLHKRDTNTHVRYKKSSDSSHKLLESESPSPRARSFPGNSRQCGPR